MDAARASRVAVLALGTRGDVEPLVVSDAFVAVPVESTKVSARLL